MDTFLDILKMILPAIASSGIVAGVYQRRIKRFDTSQKFIEVMTSRLIEGAAAISSALSAADETIRSIDDAILSGPINSNIASDRLHNFHSATQKLRSTINEHRMYITDLIPYGGSSLLNDCLVSISGSLQLLIESDNESSQDKKLREILRNSIADFTSQRDELRTQIDSLVSRLRRGHL